MIPLSVFCGLVYLLRFSLRIPDVYFIIDTVLDIHSYLLNVKENGCVLTIVDISFFNVMTRRFLCSASHIFPIVRNTLLCIHPLSYHVCVRSTASQGAPVFQYEVTVPGKMPNQLNGGRSLFQWLPSTHVVQCVSSPPCGVCLI